MLPQHLVKQYFEDGFLVVEDLFSKEELMPVLEEIAQMVDELAADLLEKGLIKDAYVNEGVYTRICKLEKAYPGTALMLHLNCELRPAIANLWSHPKILDILNQVLGPDIAGHPIWCLRSHTPYNHSTVAPWHQDTAYQMEGAEKIFQPIGWIPLIDTDASNGALQIVRGGHRSGQVFKHNLARSEKDQDSWQLHIDEKDLPEGEVVTCEVPFGSMLLMNQLVPHRSTLNISDKVRWSLDFRWQKIAPITGVEDTACIEMRKKDAPAFNIDWSQQGEFNQKKQTQKTNVELTPERVIAKADGDWMSRWQ